MRTETATLHISITSDRGQLIVNGPIDLFDQLLAIIRRGEQLPLQLPSMPAETVPTIPTETTTEASIAAT